MIDNLDVVLTIRQQLLSLVVATTGSTTLGSVGNTYTRAAGSFVDDGFVAGMEVVPTGFGENDPTTIRDVAALALTVDNDLLAEPAAVGRSLTVGLPTVRLWENKEAEVNDALWYIDEDYLPGVPFYYGIGKQADVQHQLMYVLRLSGLSNRGIGALYRVADSILSLFPPTKSFTLSDGNVVRVRTEPAPYRGQVVHREDGRPEMAITVPFWLHTQNPI